jgi:hypothetical protein
LEPGVDNKDVQGSALKFLHTEGYVMSTASISSSTPKVLPTALKSTTNAAPAKHGSGSAPSSSTAAAAAAKSTSTAVSAAAAALLESSETSAQTAKEAAGGDRQAQTLLAKTAADAAARSGATSGTRINVKA